MPKTIIILALLLAACSVQKDESIDTQIPKTVAQIAPEVKPMAEFSVTRVVYHRSTYDTSKVGYPSNGPGDTYVYTVEKDPEFESFIKDVLDQTRVNDAVTLRDYIGFKLDQNRDEIKRIDALGPMYRAPSGSGVNTSFALFDGERELYEFQPDLRRYSGERVRNLYTKTVAAENKIAAEPFEDGIPRKADDIMPPPPQKSE